MDYFVFKQIELVKRRVRVIYCRTRFCVGQFGFVCSDLQASSAGASRSEKLRQSSGSESLFAARTDNTSESSGGIGEKHQRSLPEIIGQYHDHQLIMTATGFLVGGGVQIGMW